MGQPRQGLSSITQELQKNILLRTITTKKYFFKLTPLPGKLTLKFTPKTGEMEIIGYTDIA
jgi:hypothetical protein